MSTWFDTARFGMFVHWGLSSVGGWELSWPLVGGNPALPDGQDVPIAEYYATAARFDPQAYDPRTWAAAARRAGMQYAVLTAKHHDGFALFDTRHSEFSARHTPCGRDLVRPFVEAIRAEGLR